MKGVKSLYKTRLRRYEPEENEHNEAAENEDTGYFTETLARIYKTRSIF